MEITHQSGVESMEWNPPIGCGNIWTRYGADMETRQSGVETYRAEMETHQSGVDTSMETHQSGGVWIEYGTYMEIHQSGVETY